MTSISGYRVMASPCCGSRFVAPRYASMNYSAHESWTDGQCVQSLAPTDGGSRQCECDAYFLLRNAKEVIEVSAEEKQATKPALKVVDEKLASLFTLTLTEDVELVVRRRYWRYLNDPYREIYRAHRKAVDSAAQKAKGSNTLRAQLAGKLRSVTAPELFAPPSRAFTVPPYSLTQHQKGNMQKLLHLLQKSEQPDPVEVAELHRELGRFDEATAALQACTEDDSGFTSKLLAKMIDDRTTAPVRYSL
jgi:hypothetical protein